MSEAPLLIGRAKELRALVDAMAQPPSVALVEGEPGVGKTRLIREALRDPAVRGRRVLAGSCRPLREPFPYGPVLDLLRHSAGALPAALSPVCGALRPYLPEIAHRLPPGPEPLRDARAARHRLFRAVRALLDALGGAVMVVEDLHWADDGTRDLLRFLVDDPPRGLSAVVSYRREELPGTGLPFGRAYRRPPGTSTVTLPLRPLDADGVQALCGALTGAPEPPAPFAAELHRRTAGIPFVVEEVVRALPREGRLGPEALEAMAVPAPLREAVTDRMSALSPPTVAVVHAAAVLGAPAGEALLAAVARGTDRTDGTECAAPVREALRAGVLHEWGDDRYGFRHVLAQQAVYAALPGPDRHRLHRGAMRALAAQHPQPLVQLAYHARRAGEFARWRAYGEAAASSAREVCDLALAVGMLEELLSDGRLGRRECARLAVELSRDAVLGLTHRRATELLRGIVRDSRLPRDVRGEIRLNLGLLLYNQAGRYEEGRAATALAVEELRDRPALAARGMAALAMPAWGDHPYAVHARWIERAEELAAREPEPSVSTAVRANRLALAMYGGDPEVWGPAERFTGAAGPGTDRRQAARACGNFADAATCVGRFGAAHRFRREGRRLAAECGAAFYGGIVEGTALRLDWYEGRWQGLAERARHVLDTVRDVPGIAADAHLVLGLLACTRGEWDEAAEALRAAGLADPANAPAPILASASGAMARLLRARGEPVAARAEAERGIARIRRKGLWSWAGDLAPQAVTALVRDGRLPEAERTAAELAEGIEGRDAPLASAALRACRGTLAAGGGRTAEAAALFDAARTAYAALPHPYAAARAGEAAARCRLGEGDEGTAQLLAVSEEFAALGATRDAARCRRVLRGNDVVLPSRRGRRGYGDQLSPREQDVARLVALGHTNREIADVLFLSPRTVEHHVAQVLRKLNLGSRAEVAAAPL
ncbi:LuxR family transcriptional regulator [Streptomyces albiaxialis]|uniref:LuxR family transcriptional regulator n=1 Tax=Streptomyces albiaxialis TaxID=329523 RepID=A0ABP5HE33_9ACTN